MTETVRIDREDYDDELVELAPEEGSLQLLQKVYHDARQPIERRIRCAMRALDFENPKLSAVGVGYLSGEDFSARLDRAIKYMEGRLKIIDARPIPDNPDNEQE